MERVFALSSFFFGLTTTAHFPFWDASEQASKQMNEEDATLQLEGCSLACSPRLLCQNNSCQLFPPPRLLAPTLCRTQVCVI